MRSCPRILRIVIIALASVFAADLPAQRISIDVEVSSKNVPVGGGFTVQVKRAWPKDFLASTWQDDSLELGKVDLLLVDVNIIDNQKVEVRKLRCFAFQLDSIKIPRISFTAIASKTGESLAAQSEPIFLTVASVLPKNDVGAAELPRGLMPMEFQDRQSLYFLMGFAILLVVIVVFMKKRWARPTEAFLGPHAQAELRLEAIIADSCDPNSFFDGVAELVREYIAEQFQMPAREMTSAELTRRMANISLLTDQELASLGNFLQRCDEVRYGDQTVEAEECRQVTDALLKWFRAMARWQGDQSTAAPVSVA